MESCAEDEMMVMTTGELQDWISDMVEKSKLLEPSALKISHLKSLLERREEQAANLRGSLNECAASMKKLYTLLGWEYRDTDSEDEGQSSRTSVCFDEENKDDGDAMDCDVMSQSPHATLSKIVGPSFLMPDGVSPPIVDDDDAVKKTEELRADICRILRRQPVVVLTKLPEPVKIAAPDTATPQQYTHPEEDLHINASSSLKPNKTKNTIIEEDPHINASSSLKPNKTKNKIIEEDPHINASSSLNPRKKKKRNYTIEDQYYSDISDSDPNWVVDAHSSSVNESSESDYCPEKKKKLQNQSKRQEAPTENGNQRDLIASNEVATKQKSATLQFPIKVAAMTTVSQAPTNRAEERHRAIKEESVKEHMKVLVKSDSADWQSGQICEIINDEDDGVTYKVNCDGKEVCIVPGHRIAFHHPASVDQLYVGARVVAMYKREDISRFYAGILAELPSRKNRMRFLVFFDDYNAAYMGLPNIRLVCRPLKDVCEDILDSSLKDFIKDYLNVWPHPPMVSYNVGEKINVDSDGVVKRCTVEEDDKAKEWIYRGSTRLENMINMKKIMEHVSKNGDQQVSQSKADLTKTVYNSKRQAASKIKPTSERISSAKPTKITNQKKVDGPTQTAVSYKPHDCSPDCLSRVKPKDDVESHRGNNPLSIPLLYEFRRLKKVPKSRSKSPGSVSYRSPCGLTLNTMAAVEEYLAKTGCRFLYLEMFCMDPCVSITSSYETPPSKLYLPDLTQKKETQLVPCFNEYNHIRPNQIIYSRDRVPGVGITINNDSMVGCKCTDGCRDSKACACRHLVIQKMALSDGVKQDPKAGYKHKRLNGCVITGVYECNALCGCDPRMCSNRLVQHGVQLRLQVFMTSKKGWGVRCMDHVAKGTFVCSFSGRVEHVDKKHAHYYCAELNYIEDTKHMSTDNKSESRKTETSEVKKPTKTSDPKRKTRDVTTRRDLDGKKCCYVIDASMEGNVARYINHSCNPNLFAQNVFVDTHDIRLPWLAFFTKTHIPPGTELTWDYRSVIGGIKGVSGQIDCHCGSTNCHHKL